MLYAPPRILCLPRTLAYPGSNLGKWSDNRYWQPGTRLRLIVLGVLASRLRVLAQVSGPLSIQSLRGRRLGLLHSRL